MTVLEINSGRKAQNEADYANAKTEFWFHAADLFAEGKVSIPADTILTTDLSSCKYFSAENGRFKVEPKKDVKKKGTAALFEKLSQPKLKENIKDIKDDDDDEEIKENFEGYDNSERSDLNRLIGNI